MGDESRTKLLEKGAELIRKNGFNNTGLTEILQAAGVPRGSFYYYFKSKEQFGLQLIDYLHEGIRRAFYGYLSEDSGEPSLVRLRKFFEYFRATFTSEEQKCGCPIGNISQELAAVNPLFRERLQETFADITKPVEICLGRARGSGEIDPNADTQELAEFIVSSWQGALLSLKVAGCARPLELFEKYVFDVLLAKR